MDSKNQLFYFCVCIVIGFVGGIPYELFAAIRQFLGCDKGKNKIFGIILDVVYPVLFAGLCIYVQFLFHFPALRVYMWIGYAFGFIIYLKSLRRILAFLQKLCYNKLAKLAKKAKIRKKLSKKKGGRIYDAR